MKAWQMKQISDAVVVKAVAQYSADARGSPFPYQIIAADLGCPEKVAYRACERAASRYLIDYGVSLRTGWLTDAGKVLLASQEG